MPTDTTVRAAALCASILAASALIAFAGPLDPPAGPVAPTYKTLAEVEPRIAINAANTPGDGDSLYRIAQPGSYYLTGNVTGVSGKRGIEVASRGVTIDLMGFRLRGDMGLTLEGIRTVGPGIRSLTVRNGTIEEWGRRGIDAADVSGCIIEDVRFIDDVEGGVRCGSAGVVARCIVGGYTGYGIEGGRGSMVRDCAASGCVVAIEVQEGVIERCAMVDNEHGIYAAGGVVRHCSVSYCTGDGITVTSNTYVHNNWSSANGAGTFGEAAGLRVLGSGNRIDSNELSFNQHGLRVDDGRNLIVRNSAHSNAIANYTVVAGQTLGPIVPAGPIASESPWANLEF